MSVIVGFNNNYGRTYSIPARRNINELGYSKVLKSKTDLNEISFTANRVGVAVNGLRTAINHSRVGVAVNHSRIGVAVNELESAFVMNSPKNIINTCSVGLGITTGLSTQIPGAGMMLKTFFLDQMIRRLANHHKIPYKKEPLKIATATMATMTVCDTPLDPIKYIPVIGNFVSATSNFAFAKMVGKLIDKQLSFNHSMQVKIGVKSMQGEIKILTDNGLGKGVKVLESLKGVKVLESLKRKGFDIGTDRGINYLTKLKDEGIIDKKIDTAINCVNKGLNNGIIRKGINSLKTIKDKGVNFFKGLF